MAAQGPNFEFHPKCEGIKLTHVNFADDIFLLTQVLVLVQFLCKKDDPLHILAKS